MSSETIQRKQNPIVVGTSVLVALFVMAGLGLLPVLYLKAQQAEQRLAPLQTELTTAHASIEEQRGIALSAKAEVDEARAALLAQSDAAANVVKLQAALEREQEKRESLSQELSKALTTNSSLDGEVQRLRLQSESDGKELLAMRTLLGSQPDEAIQSSLSNALHKMADLERTNADFAARNNVLENQLATRRDFDGRQSSRPLQSPMIVQRTEGMTACCQIQTELPRCVHLNPGEVLISVTIGIDHS